MAQAIVVDGAERGQITKVCAEPSCAVHFPGQRTPDSAKLAKEREARRKELEQRKLETTVRHRTSAEVLKMVSSPMERGDLVLIADALLERTQPLRREAIARRHKLVDGAASEVTYPQVQKGPARMLRQLDEGGLSKLIVEIVLLDSVESSSGGEALLTATKRHRVDPSKARSAAVAEVKARATKAAAKQKKSRLAKVRKATAAA